MKFNIWRKLIMCIAGTLFLCLAIIAVFPAAAQADDEPEENAAQVSELVAETSPGVIEEIATEPEMQQELGLNDEDSLLFENSETENAIQQAVNMALNQANNNTDIKSVTIVVKEGTYDGITIDRDADGGYTLANDFKIEVIAEDAEAAGGSMDNSEGGVRMDGNIYINGIDVLLAGMYMVGDSLVNAKDAQVEIAGTTEDDKLDINVSEGAEVDINTGEGNDEVSMTGDTAGSETDPLVHEIYLGEGEDTLTVDTSVGQATAGDTTVNVDGAAGSDKVDMTGTLTAFGSSSAGIDTVSGDAVIDLDTQSGDVNINTQEVEVFTDTLENKQSVHVPAPQAVYNLGPVFQFTDYIIDNYTNGDNIIIAYVGLPFLTNIVIDANSLLINGITAGEINIVLKGKDVTIGGTVHGRNITVIAQDDDTLASLTVENDTLPDFSITVGMFDFVTNAKITITSSAQIIATETVKLMAQSDQRHAIMPGAGLIAADPNFINIKVGNAEIEILGTIIAGAAVNISSNSLLKMAVSNQALADYYIPLCASVAVLDSLIKLSGTGSITSLMGSVNMHSVANALVTSKAITGAIPFAFALSVVDVSSKIIMDGTSVINAQNSNCTMNAEGNVYVLTTTTSKVDEETSTNTNQSAGFASISIVSQDVGVFVIDDAQIDAKDISAIAYSKQKATTQAMSNNTAVQKDENGDGLFDDGEGTFTLTEMINAVTLVLNTVSSGSSNNQQSKDAADKASGKAKPDESTTQEKDNKGAENVFDQGTMAAGEQDTSGGGTTSNSSAQVAGALAITYAANHSSAWIETNGSVAASGELMLDADSSLITLTKADNRPPKNENPPKPTVAIGVSLGLAVIDSENQAYLSAGTLSCESLAISADTSNVKSDLQAFSGASGFSSVGISGAAAINLVKAVTSASLESDIEIAGGDVSVTSSQISVYTTKAEASCDGASGAKLGIGSGLSLSIIGNEVNAYIADNVIITMAGIITAIGDVTIEASLKNKETAASKAGAAGGNAIVPVLTLVISGSQANAYIGAATNNTVTLKSLSISAVNSSIRTATADADAKGNAGVGLGGAFLIDIINDGAQSKLKRSINAQNIGIYAESRSVFTGKTKASANGAASNKKKTDPEPATTGGSGSSGSTPAPPPEEADTDGEEGDADKLADDNVEAAKPLADKVGTNNVNSTALSGLSQDRQGAQTSEGKISIAAGLVLNIQNNSSISEIADNLNIVVASLDSELGNVSVVSANKTDSAIIANASAVGSGSAKLGVGVAVAINIVTYDNIALIGNSTISCKNLSVKSIIPYDEETDKKGASLNDLIVMIVTEFVGDLVREIGLVNDANLEAQLESAIGEIVNEILVKLQAGTGLEKLFQGDIEKILSERLEVIEGALPADIQEAKTLIMNEMLARLHSLLGGSSITNFNPSTISGALKLEATKLVKEFTKSFLDIDKLRKYLSGDVIKKVRKKLTTIIISLHPTSDLLPGLLTGWTGSDADNPYGHTITTETIAGAGSAKVGIAGSAAITVVKGNTDAKIAGSASLILGSDIEATGNIEIIAQATNVIKTTASSAVSAKGGADKNKNAANNANSETSGGDEQPSTEPADQNNLPADPDPNDDHKSDENTPENKQASVGIGAAFAFNYLDFNVLAGIGENRRVSAGTLDIQSDIYNKIETISVSGQDPITNRSGDAAKTGIDASAAVNLANSVVRSYVDTGCVLTTLGGNALNIADSDAQDVDLEHLINTHIFANEESRTLTQASGFAKGENTAVGAAVAVNVTESLIEALFKGAGNITGDMIIAAETYIEDGVNAIATAVGSDSQRNADKLNAQTGGSATSDDIVNGQSASGTDVYPAGTSGAGNGTQDAINKKLDEKSNSESGNDDPNGKDPSNPDGESGKGEKTSSGAALSANVLRSQDAKTPASPDSKEGNDAANNNSDISETTTDPSTGQQTTTDGVSPGNTDSQQESTKLRVAAAVGLNITEHETNAEVMGTLVCTASVTVLSQNNGSFNTLATGAAISTGSGESNNIGLGAAISLNQNRAYTTVEGTIDAQGDVALRATLAQNSEGDYKGMLGALAIGGAISSQSGKLALAGAAAVIISHADTKVRIAAGSSIIGDNIKVIALDKSKLAARAGALSVSRASVGMGVSFAVIFAHNKVTSIIESEQSNVTAIQGNSLWVSARKLKIDYNDYSNEVDKDNAVSATENTNRDNEGYDPGNNESGGAESAEVEVYEVDFTFDTDAALGFVNIDEFLNGTNFFAEAISGAASTSDSKLTMAGSFALVFFYNTTTAEIGDYADIDIAIGGDMTVEAAADTTCRIIAGAVSVGPSKVGIGLTLGFINNRDKTYALVGEHVYVNEEFAPVCGEVNIIAHAIMDMLMLTIAAAGSSSGTAIGGSLNFILSENDVQAIVGDYTQMHQTGGVHINAINSSYLLLAALSAAVSTSSSAAVGGTVSIIITGNSALAKVGEAAKIYAPLGGVTVQAQNEEYLFALLASISGSSGTGVAGTLSAQIARSKSQAVVESNAQIRARDTIKVRSVSNTFALGLMAGFSAGNNAAGLTIVVNIFGRTVKSLVGANAVLISSQGNVIVEALAKDWLIICAVAGAAAGGTSIAGCLPVVIGENHIESHLYTGATLEATQGSVAVNADLEEYAVVPAGAVAVGGGTSIGGTIVVILLRNIIKAIVESECKLYAGASIAATVKHGDSTKDIYGILVKARGIETLVTIGISAGGGGGASVKGVFSGVMIVNTIISQIGEEGVDDVLNVVSEKDIEVSAEDHAIIVDCAGAVSIGGSAGVGITAVAIIFGRQIRAGIYGSTQKAGDTDPGVDAGRDILIYAHAYDDLWLFTIAFSGGGSAGVSGDANVILFENVVKAQAGGLINADRDITIKTNSDSIVFTLGIGLGVGGPAGVAAVFIITYFKSVVQTTILQGAHITALGDVLIEAKSHEGIYATGASAGGAATAGVAGTLNLMFVEISTNVITENDVHITGSSVRIEANDDYNILGIVGSFGIGPAAAGVGIAALIALVFSNVTTLIGENNVITSTVTDVNIHAKSDRVFDAVCFVASGGLYAGVSVGLAVLVAGGSLTNDTATIFSSADGGFEVQDTIDSIFQSKNAHNDFNVSDSSGQSSADKCSVGTRLDSDGTEASDQGVQADGFADAPTNPTPQGDETEEEAMARESEASAQNDSDAITNRTSGAPDERTDGFADVVSTVISSGTVIKSNNDITISSQDKLSVDMITGIVAISGVAGVGVGISIGILFSDVTTMVENTARLEAVDNIYVKATSGNEKYDPSQTIADASVRAKSAAKKDEIMGQSGTVSSGGMTIEGDGDSSDEVEGENTVIDFLTATARVITVNVGGGLVGVGVSVSGLMMFTKTKVIMAGNVTLDDNVSAGADNVFVTANSNFGMVISVTLSIKGGGVAVGVAVSISLYEAKVEASISGLAKVIARDLIEVATYTTTNVVAFGTALAGGGIAVNASSTIAINRTRIDTFIGQGAIAEANNIRVKTVANTQARAVTIAAAFGAGGINATLSLALLIPTIYTYIGETPGGTPLAHSQGTGGYVKARQSVLVKNYAVGNSDVIAVSVAGGMQGQNGAVGLSFNYIKGYAAINKASVSATDALASIKVQALMKGDAILRAYGLAIGTNAAGLIVGISMIFADNTAMIDTTGTTVSADNIYVTTYDSASSLRYESTASTDIMTAAVGGSAVSQNLAFSLNMANNAAVVKGSGVLNADELLDIYADGWTTSVSDIKGINAGALAIAVSISMAYLRSTQTAQLQGVHIDGATTTKGTYNIGSLSVVSKQNYSRTDDNDAYSNIFIGGGGLVSATGQIGIVISNASGTASAGGGDLTINNDITVHSFARSNSKVQVDSCTPVDGYSVGLVFALAIARGEFTSQIDTEDAVIKAGNIDIKTIYTAKSDVIVNPAVGGVKISVASGDVNLAIAKITTRSYAGITGSGTINYTGTINVLNEGLVQAKAHIKGAVFAAGAVQMTINVVVALLDAKQNAYIENATLNGSGDINVTSNYNLTGHTFQTDPNTTDDELENVDYKAEAKVGGNKTTNMSMSLVGGDLNSATAKSQSTVKAYMSGVTINTSGNINIKTDAETLAFATIEKPTVQASAVSIAANLTIADSTGTYEAYVDSTGGSINAANININTIYEAWSSAYIANSLFSASVASVSLNAAYAYAAAQAKAYLKGNGIIDATGNILIKVTGDGKAQALVKASAITISLASLKATATYAKFDAVQKAYIDITGGSITAGNNINIHSYFNEGQSGNSLINAVAKSGNLNSASASIANLSASVGAAITYTRNYAYIEDSSNSGLGSVTASNGSIDIRANTKSKSLAMEMKGLSLSVYSMSGVKVYSYTCDVTQAYIKGKVEVNAYDTSDSQSNGNITIDGYAKTESKAVIKRDANISLYGISVMLALGTIGTYGLTQEDSSGNVLNDKRQTVKAYIGANSTINTDRNLNINAYNEGKPDITVDLGTSGSALNVNVIIIKSVSYYETFAGIGASSVVNVGGSVTVLADNYATAETYASMNSYGFISIGEYYARNDMDQLVKVEIGSSAQIFAEQAISIVAKASAKLKAKTTLASSGLAGVSGLRAYNTLTRNVSTTVMSGVEIESYNGNISIGSESGMDDSITTVGEGSGNGLAGIANGQIYTSITSNANTVVKNSVKITTTFKTLTIYSKVGIGYLYTKIRMDAGGLGASTDSFAYINTLILNATTEIAKTNSGARAELTAKNVYITSSLEKLNIFVRATTKVSGFGVEGDAKGEMTMTSLVKTYLNNCVIRGYDKVRILNKMSPSGKVDIYSYAAIYAFAGDINIKSIFYDNSSGVVDIGGNVDIYGADVYIDAQSYSGPVSLYADGKRRALASKSTTKTWARAGTGGYGRTEVIINSATEFFIGDAAAGIIIRIRQDSAGSVYVEAVGIAKDKPIWKINSLSQVVEFLGYISNAYPGKLRVHGSLNGNIVHTQEYISYIRIYNESDYDLVLSGADMHNSSYVKPVVIASGTWRVVSREADETNPRIPTEGMTVRSYNPTDVTIGNNVGVIFSEIRTTTFIWMDEDGLTDIANSGNLYSDSGGSMMADKFVGSLWAHELVIINANNIGKKIIDPATGDEIIERFTVYLTLKDNKTPNVNLQAHNDVYISLTLAQVEEVPVLDAALSTSAFGVDLLLEYIEAGGVLDLLLPADVRLQYLEGETGIKIILPGVVQYTELDYFSAGNANVVDIDRYILGAGGGNVIYELPDGTKFYADETGRIIRVVEIDKVVDNPTTYEQQIQGTHRFDNYEYRMENNNTELIITLVSEGIEINLFTGRLKVLDNADEEITFSAFLPFDQYQSGMFTHGDFIDNWNLGLVGDIRLIAELSLFMIDNSSGTNVRVNYDWNNEVKYWKEVSTDVEYYVVKCSGSLSGELYDYHDGYLYIIEVDVSGGGYEIVNGYTFVVDNGTMLPSRTYKSTTWETYVYDVAQFGADNWIKAVAQLNYDSTTGAVTRYYRFLHEYNMAGGGLGGTLLGSTYVYYQSGNSYYTLDTNNLAAMLGGDTALATEVAEYFSGWSFTYAHNFGSLVTNYASTKDWTHSIDAVYDRDKAFTYKQNASDSKAANVRVDAFTFRKDVTIIPIFPQYIDAGIYIEDIRRVEYTDNAQNIVFEEFIDNNVPSSVNELILTGISANDPSISRYSPTQLYVSNLLGAYITLGENNEILLRQMTFNGIDGYMPNESTFIALDGTVYFDFEYNRNATTLLGLASFNGDTGVYDDDHVTINGTDDISTATVTIKEGEIRYEYIAEDINATPGYDFAFDFKGNYFYTTDNGVTWHSASLTDVSSNQTLRLDVDIDLFRLKTGDATYDFDSITHLTGATAAMSMTVFTLKNSGGETAIFYKVPINTTKSMLVGDDGSVVILGAGDIAKQQEVLGQIYRIGELFGTIVRIKMEDTQGSILDDNVDYLGAPLDSDDDEPGGPEIDITATERVIFMADSSGSIGTNSNKIDIESPIIDYLDLNGDDVITTNTYLTALGVDTIINDGVPFVIKGVHFQVIGIDCDLYYGKIDVIANDLGHRGFLEIIANNGRILPTNMHPDTDITITDTDKIINGIITLDKSDADLIADGNVVMNHFIGSNNSAFYIESRTGSVYVYAEDGDPITDGYLTLSNSSADITAANNVSYNTITTSGASQLDIDAQTGAINNTAKDHDNADYLLGTDCSIYLEDTTANMDAATTLIYNELTIVDSVVDINTGSHINLFDADSFIYIDPSIVTMTAGGDFNYHSVDVIGSDFDVDAAAYINLLNEDSYIYVDLGSNVNFTAGLDITYHLVDVVDSSLALRSTGGNIFPLNAESRVIVTGDTSGLTLSALYDISYEHMHMWLDIPEAVMLQIEYVTNYWIDAVHWPLYVPIRPPVFEGWNEFAEWVENLGPMFNEHVEYIGIEELISVFMDILDDEWAQMIIDAMLRSEWLAIVTDGSIETLIQNEEIGAAWLASWLEDETITEEFVRTHLDNLINFSPGTIEYDDAIAWLSQMEANLRDAVQNKDPLVVVSPADPSDPMPFVITDVMVDDLLVLLLHEDALERILDPLSMITPEMIEQRLMNVSDRIAVKITEEFNPDDADARDINIHVGESVGNTYVTNEGSIIITQDRGTMTLDLIDSVREDAALSALGGHIQSIPDPGRAVIFAENIWMYALDSIGHYNFPIRCEQMTTETIMVANILDEYLDLQNVELVPDNPLTADVDETIEAIYGLLTSEVRFDWIRILDPYAPTSLYAHAENGSLYAVEETGTMGLHFAGAGTDANLRAESIVDTRDETDTSLIIEAGNSLYIEVDEDGIGTEDDYFNTNVGYRPVAADANASMTRIIAPDDIFITDLSDTILVVTTDGHVNIETLGNLVLENLQLQGPYVGSVDLLLGYVEALGFAEITSLGEIIEGERRMHAVTVRANGMSLTSNGNLGYHNNPFEIDMLGGDFSAYADQVIIDEFDDHINIEEIISLGDVIIVAPGEVTSNDTDIWNLAAEYQFSANDAQNQADAMQTIATILQDVANEVRLPADEADAALAAAQLALDDGNTRKADLEAQLALETNPDERARLQDEIDAVDDEIVKLTEKRDLAQAEAARIHAKLDAEIIRTQIEADTAQMDADWMQMIADWLQSEADMYRAIAMTEDITITSLGDIKIYAGEGIGEFRFELSMSATGDLTMIGGVGVYIAGRDDFDIARITAAQNVSIMNMDGYIRRVSGTDEIAISGQYMYLFALGREDIGTQYTPMTISATGLYATGKNINIKNYSSNIDIAQVDAKEDLILRSAGSIGSAFGMGDCAGDNIAIYAGGDIGSDTEPIYIHSENVYIEGGYVDIYLTAYRTNINKIAAADVEIDALGYVRGGIIYASNLRIHADGRIFTEQDPLYIYVSRIINVKSTYYEAIYDVTYINLYPFLDNWLNRQLEAHYLAIYAIAMPYLLPGGVEKTLYMLIGLKEDGTWDVLGFWAFADGDSFDDIVQNLVDRGVLEIDLIFVDGRGEFEDAFLLFFPNAAICVNTYLWVLNGRDINEVDEEFEEMLTDLRAMYETETQQEAIALFDEFMTKWTNRYPEIAEHLDSNWQCYLDAFDTAKTMREAGFDLEFMQQMIDTMAAAINGRGMYPNDVYFFQAMFDIMVSFFPAYKTEVVIE